jgi:hypothetical protein
MERNRLKHRPFLKNVIDDLLENVQGVRLREEVLPLDTYAQTEFVAGRVEVSINSRISDVPGVKDPGGVAYVAKWHESIHVEFDTNLDGARQAGDQECLPGLVGEAPRTIACRRVEGGFDDRLAMEFRAENAGLAAAIAIQDLERCEPYSEWRRLLAQGGDVSKPGWTLLYSIAGEIGVNPSALVKLYGQLGVLAVLDSSEGRRLIATTSLVGEEDWIR